MTLLLYNKKLLLSFCKKNSLTNVRYIANDKKEKQKTGPAPKSITRETIILGDCKTQNCGTFVKSFRKLYEKKSPFCELCTKVNANQKLHLVDKVKKYYNNNLQGKHFALWGLAFKPNTDDIREAPALSIIDAITNAGATITSFDPEAMPNVKKKIGDKIKYASNQYQALEGADALLIATEWSEFRTPDFERMEQLMAKNKIIFDGRNLFDVSKMNELGYHYESIGRADTEI
jgi:UDPglucose 6-dehydrogenase